ncbi:MAG: hypothetical protein C5B56_08720 [Proteobacteria bacterium]|nr:MAG: hypothetical protein C5B56_08720 [Pseudomonadota bacterium]
MRIDDLRAIGNVSEPKMENVFCFAVLIGKVLCFAVFIAALSPSHIGTVQAPPKPMHATAKHAYCDMKSGISATTLVPPRAV